MPITREDAIANINSVKSTSATDKARAISMLDRYFPPSNNTNTTGGASGAGSSSASTRNIQSSGGGGNNVPDFMAAIQAQLLGQSGMISSTNSQLESRLNSAIGGIGQARDATGKLIESAYGRERAFQEGQAGLAVQNQLEGRTGFATQMVAFRNLVETTDKNLNDLEQRKQEALLNNDAQAASKMADLQFKALEFQQQAQQQTFSNLLGMANFGLQSAQEQRLAKAQSFSEQKSMSDIALQYGIELQPGDTMDSITSKAMVFAGEEQKLRLAKMQSEIRYTNAQTAKVMAGDGKNAVINDGVVGKLASEWNSLKGQKFSVETNQEMQNILGMFSDNPANLNKFYAAVAKDAEGSVRASVDAMTQKKEIAQKGVQPNAWDMMIFRITGEKPPGWQKLPDGSWRRL